jgi:hypothetical protein
MKRHTLLFAASFAASSLAGRAYADDDASGESTIELFLRICAIPYAHLELVEREVKSLGFTELQGIDASSYLDGASGRVWTGAIESRRCTIAVRPEVLCTLAAHDGDATAIKAAVESWLPPDGSGITVTRDAIPSPGPLETAVFELRGGKVRERWLITTSSDPASEIRALLSWNPL